jgi:predicted metalloprotease with PDZ domain
MKHKPELDPPPDTRPASELLYVIQPCLDGDCLYLNVELSFKGDGTGETRIKLPFQWAGQKGLDEGIKAIQAASPHTTVIDTCEPQTKIVKHPRSRKVSIRYQVHQDWSGDLSEQGRYFRPILQKEYFHFIGEALFIHPVWNVTKPRRITLDWKGLPAKWKVSNSFGANQRFQVIKRPISQLRHAIYVGGDFRIKRLIVNSNPVYVALRGDWRFSDEDYFDLIKRIIKIERTFWNDFDFPYFLITLIPTGTRCCHYGGTGLTDSFATFISTDKPVDARLKHLLTHELFHTWNGRKIKRQRPEELVYWFTEGFTEYYTRLLLLRSGLMTFEEYIKNYNKVILDYYCSPYRNEKNRTILKDYWRIRAVRQLPYQRGDILAHNWNRLILATTEGRFSLDNIMLDLLEGAQSEGLIVSASNINKLIRRYLPQGVRQQLKEYIDNGVLIPPHESALGPCAELKMMDMRLYDLGFNYEVALSRGVICGVKEGSNAYRAGLRNDDQIRARTIYFGDSTKAVEIKVKAARGEKLISFWPVGDKIRVPQYVLDVQRFNREAENSLSWFGLSQSSLKRAVS